jgi:8-oxo-dGTP pyrophosphatase MutT (NUDIX family)
VILHRHKKLGIWVQPGGHIDDGEMPWEAACREATEETGLPVTLWRPDVCHVDVHPGPRGHTHYDVRYLVVAPPLDPSPPADESQDVWWFSWDDALARAEEALRPALAELSRLLADVVLD